MMSAITMQMTVYGLGFLDVTGYLEERVDSLVFAEGPENFNRFDVNNGMVAITCNRGHRWVIPAKVLQTFHPNKRTEEVLKENFPEIQQGCYVPFSNDGGSWMKKVWPWIFGEPTP
jgi:hypothetical protein